MNNAKHLLWIPSGAAFFLPALFTFALLLTLFRDFYYLIFFSAVYSPFCFLYQEKQAASQRDLSTETLSLGLIGNHL